MSPQWHGKRCKVCGGYPQDVGPISATSLCQTHATERLNDNIAQLYEHRGPNFRKWRQGMAASVGATLPDEIQQSA